MCELMSRGSSASASLGPAKYLANFYSWICAQIRLIEAWVRRIAPLNFEICQNSRHPKPVLLTIGTERDSATRLAAKSMKVKSDRTSSIAVWSIAIIATVSVVGGALVAPIDGVTGPDFPRFVGRFHPLVLHFPIAFLVVAPLLEAGRLFERTAQLAQFTPHVLLLAALTAALTVGLGLTLAASEGHAGSLIEQHRWGGVAVVALTFLAWAARVSAGRIKHSAMWTAYGGILSCACLALFVTAHAGGSLVHGPGYLTEYAPRAIANFLENLASVEPEVEHEPASISRASAQRFHGEVLPLLKNHC